MNKDFNSVDEYLFYKQLKEIGINPLPNKTFTIDKGFTTKQGKKYKDITYTPDFIFSHKDKTYVIEVKGYSLFDNPIKYRLAHKYFDTLNYEYHKISLKGSTKDNTKGFYDYSSNKSKRANKSKEYKRGLLRLFFYKEGIITLQTPLTPLKTPKIHRYENVYEKANVEWYQENIDDSEIDGDWLEEYIYDNYFVIGPKRSNDENKMKYIRK